jgi:T1SS-143 domain-containing protein
MRLEDNAQSALNQTGAPDARDDADHLAAQDFGPAVGNIITGSGTTTGAVGTDMVGGGSAKIVAIEGAGGRDTSFTDGKLVVEGEYGTLTIEADGDYSYVRHAGTPAGVSDVFTYTLQSGSTSDTARLIINIGDVPRLATDGTRVVSGADGVVMLPAGVELSDVRVVGRDLVITLPDGSTMVIPDGAIFVPQLVIDGVEIPAANLATLLIGSEPQPAAGDLASSQQQQQSSGGNFAVTVQPLDPGVPLGDLLPPTELAYVPPEFEEIGQFVEENDPPLIIGSAINVSEEGLAGALPDTDPGPPQDTTNLSVVTGTVTLSDPNDDALVVSLGIPTDALTSHGVAVTWTLSTDGKLLTGSAGGNPVVTVSITDSGAYTVTLLRPIDHPTGGGENILSINVPVTVSDGDLVAIGAIGVTFEDDSPSASGALAASGVVLDETSAGSPSGFPIGATSAAAMISAGGSFGADGAAATAATSYAIGLTGGVASLASGLFTADGHQPIMLVQTNATTISGTYGSGLTAFTIVANGNGTVTYTQFVPLDHVTDGSSADALNDSSTPITFSGLITISVTLTDFDGDSASATVAIGDRISVFDDGPSIATTSAAEPTLVVDETDLATDASASFAGLFTAGSFGADGAGTKVYTVTTVDGTDSGLIDVATGDKIWLFNDGSGGVIAKVGATSAAALAGSTVAFTVTVDGAGVVELDQVRAVRHPTADPDEPISIVNDGAIKLVATITDKDGDSASASVDIAANLTFKDDGPTAAIVTTGVSVVHDETAGEQDDDVASATFVVGGLIGDDLDVPGTGPIGYARSTASLVSSGSAYGADGAGTTIVSLEVSSQGVSSGLFTTEGTEIFLFKEGNVIVGRAGVDATAAATGVAAFAIQLDGSNRIEVVQYLSLKHPLGGASNPDDRIAIATGALIAKTTVTDKDGDTATATTGIGDLVKFDDDAPSAVSAAPITSGLTNGGGDSETRNLDGGVGGNNTVFDNFGADGGKVIFTAATITALQGQNLKHGGAPLSYVIDSTGQLLTGYVESGATAGFQPLEDKAIFTIQLQSGAPPSSNYTVTMLHSLDSVSNINFNDGTYDFVGGNDPWAGFVPLGQIDFKAGNTPVNDDSKDLLLTPFSNGAGEGNAVNGNANSAGVTGGGGGQNVGTNEGIRLDFVIDLTGNPAGSPANYDGNPAQQDHVFDTHYQVNDASVRFGDGQTDSTISIQVFDASDASDIVLNNGSMISITQIVISYDGENQVFTFDPMNLTKTETVGTAGGLADRTYTVEWVLDVSGKYYVEVTGILDINVRIATRGATNYEALEIEHLSGDDFALTGFGAAVQSNNPVNFTVPITVTDNDGDTVSSGSLAITVTPPVVLDMDGDGVEFVDRSAGVAFDYDGDGVAETTAWAGADDAILVRDANGNGVVDSAAEFVFGGSGLTDMEALRAQYGHTLDAADADYAMFKVWQDANLNGVADEGEMVGLAEAGITSINLVSDGKSYTAANGDVIVAGSASYTRADGTTGTAADAMFVSGSTARATQEVERIAANGNAMIVAAAAAAAGLAIELPAAATTSIDLPMAFGNALTAIEPTGGSFADLASSASLMALSTGLAGGATAVHDMLGALSWADSMGVGAGDLAGEIAAFNTVPMGLGEATNAMSGHMQMPTVDTGIAMPSFETMAALDGAKHSGTVEKILADALSGGDGPSIDALLNALPGPEVGGIAGLDGSASGIPAAVPTWDMGATGGFTIPSIDLITSEAMVLHHDAVQPMMNG